MISFTLLTNTPAQVRTFLVNQGIITLQTVEGVPNTPVPVIAGGLEWVEVPNPIPADTRHVYLVKFAWAGQDDQQAGISQTGNLLQNTKLGQWILANSTEDDLIVGGTTVSAWRVGTNTWAVLDPLGLFGVWQ